MTGIKRFDLDIREQELPLEMVSLYRESHRTRCNQDGYYILARDEELKKEYSAIKDIGIGEVRSNYYPYGVSNNKYPYDSNGMEIRGVRFLLIMPERRTIFGWIKSHADYRIIIRYLMNSCGYFPDVPENDLFSLFTTFIREEMYDYEFATHPVVTDKAKRWAREFDFKFDESELLASKIILQSERLLEMRTKEVEKGLNDSQVTKDMEAITKMIGKLSDIKNGSLKDTTRQFRELKLRQEQMTFDQSMLKNQEDDGLSHRDMLETSESRIIGGLANLPESVRKVMEDQGSRRKILKMVEIMKGKDKIEVIDDKDLSKVVSNRIVVTTEELTLTEVTETTSETKDVDDDDIIVI